MTGFPDLFPLLGRSRFLVGDVFDRMADLPDGSVDLVLTSPPFLALRSYLPADHPDKAKEIGSEPTPAAFLDTLLHLTAEWRRLLAPHGSICVELGDTYSGSGGAGGDYNAEGMRAGQEKFAGSMTVSRRRDREPVPRQRRGEGDAGWPLAKSLCGIPHLYHLSLAYGRNLLTGEPSQAGQWRVRNVVVWCRPNPPVGALGDKFRPGTSYMTVACVSDKRYFDLDAVRTEAPRNDNRRAMSTQYQAPGQSERKTRASDENGRIYANANGAPPLDWWEPLPGEQEMWDQWAEEMWEIPTSPYKGSHYATWPPALCERPIKAMCPPGGMVLDPFAGSGTTLAKAVALGRDAIGIDIDRRNADLAIDRVRAVAGTGAPIPLTIEAP